MRLKKLQVILRKRLCFILEKVYVNNRPFLVLTGTGFAADIFVKLYGPYLWVFIILSSKAQVFKRFIFWFRELQSNLIILVQLG